MTDSDRIDPDQVSFCKTGNSENDESHDSENYSSKNDADGFWLYHRLNITTKAKLLQLWDIDYRK